MLAHLGYDYHTPALPSRPPPLLPTKDRRQEASSRHTSSKSVYSCLVVGPKDAGKTTFCQRFLGRGHEATADIPPEELPRSTVNSVTVYGQPKYLVLLDTDINTAADCLTPLQVRIQSCHVVKPGRLAGSLIPPVQTSCDVICLVYDSSSPRSLQCLQYELHLSGVQEL